MHSHKAIGSAANQRQPRWRLAAAAMLLGAAVAFAGCGSLSGDETAADDDSAQGDVGEPLPPPAAHVAITYKRPGDALARAIVTKFFGAEVIQTKPRDATHAETIVRFDGGVPIWEFKSEQSTLSALGGFGERKFAPASLEYGTLPPGFTQIIPEEGPPEPLDRGSYYVFEIERRSGSASYQAVKVLADGSLQAYAAQPRAGSSYLLCCNVAAGFPEPVVLPETAEPQAEEPSDQPAGESGGGSP